MLSGIGPKLALEKLGIKVMVDLPGVGMNLQDHCHVPVAYTCKEPISVAGVDNNIEEIKKYELDKTGMFSSNIVESGGFQKLKSSSRAPELQYHFLIAYFIDHGFKNPEGHGFTLFPGLVGTQSVGRLELRSNNPMDPPRINPNYLAEEADIEVLVQGVKVSRRILNSAAFDRYRGEEYLPGATVKTDEQIREFIRDYVTNIYHPAGTCKMGNDSISVVNEQLKVYGVKGLRIADASIMPVIINANTNVPCMMIGEKCAHMILQTNNSKL